MNISNEVTFTTTKCKSKLMEGKERYQGQLRHHVVHTKEGTVAAYAKYRGISEVVAENEIRHLGAFMADEIAQGNRIDLGVLSVGMKLTDGFDAANAPFDPARQSIAVVLTPGKKLKEAVKALKPVNVTPDGGMRITGTYQSEPYSATDEIAADGERLVASTGVALAGDGESGVWIESDAGEKLLAAEIISVCDTYVRYRFTGAVTPGLHWLVIAKRLAGNLFTTKRRITVRRYAPYERFFDEDTQTGENLI